MKTPTVPRLSGMGSMWEKLKCKANTCTTQAIIPVAVGPDPPTVYKDADVSGESEFKARPDVAKVGINGIKLMAAATEGIRR
jgi:hypothetical protein